jgi:hypothetical protein
MPTLGSDEAIVAKGDVGLVQDNEVEIREKSLAYADVLSIVAQERLVDKGVFVGLSQHLFAASRCAPGAA